MKIFITSIFTHLCLLYSCSEYTSNNNTIIHVESSIKTKEITKSENNNTISKEHLLGKFNPAKDSLFIEVPAKYCLIRTEYVHKDVLKPFIAMHEAAAKQNINLNIISAHRTFDVQKWLWNQKYYKSDNPIKVVKEILKYLAMPGTSRHHWGTDIDFLSTKLNYFETEEGKKAYNWLQENAKKYGFSQVYTSDRENGYKEEKWHWSYIPVANKFQQEYKNNIKYEDFKDFFGCEVAEELNVIENYVFAINKELLKY